MYKMILDHLVVPKRKEAMKTTRVGTSLAVQWLKLCLPMQEVGLILVPKIPHVFGRRKKKVQKYRSSSGRTVVAASMLFPPTLNSLQSSLQNRLDCHLFPYSSLMAPTVRGPPAMPETRVQSLVWEESLEKEMATHCSTLAWKIPRMEEPGRPQSMGSQRVGQD